MGFKIEKRYREDNPGLTDQQIRDMVLVDTKDWLGVEVFNNLVEYIKSPIVRKGKMAYRCPSNIRMSMAFLCGIEGFPVQVMIQRYHPRSIRLFGVDCMGKTVTPIRRV